MDVMVDGGLVFGVWLPTPTETEVGELSTLSADKLALGLRGTKRVAGLGQTLIMLSQTDLH